MRPLITLTLTLTLLFPLTALAQPLTIPTKPASTQPKAPPKQIIKLLSGSVKLAVPHDWTESARSEGEKGKAEITFTSPDGIATVQLQVVPQEFPIPQKSDAFREKVKTSLIANMKRVMEARNQEILYGPRSETDDRFYQRIHTRAKDGDVVLDELHLFRAAALDLLVVSAVAKTDQPAEAKKYHTIAEDISLSITVGSAEKPK